MSRTIVVGYNYAGRDQQGFHSQVSSSATQAYMPLKSQGCLDFLIPRWPVLFAGHTWGLTIRGAADAKGMRST